VSCRVASWSLVTLALPLLFISRDLQENSAVKLLRALYCIRYKFVCRAILYALYSMIRTYSTYDYCTAAYSTRYYRILRRISPLGMYMIFDGGSCAKIFINQDSLFFGAMHPLLCTKK
jgi:hypothetical protein